MANPTNPIDKKKIDAILKITEMKDFNKHWATVLKFFDVNGYYIYYITAVIFLAILTAVIPSSMESGRRFEVVGRLFYFLLLLKMGVYAYACYFLSMTIGEIKAGPTGKGILGHLNALFGTTPKGAPAGKGNVGYASVLYLHNHYVLVAEVATLFYMELLLFFDYEVVTEESKSRNAIRRFSHFRNLVVVLLVILFTYILALAGHFNMNLEQIYMEVGAFGAILLVIFVTPAVTSVITGRRCFSLKPKQLLKI